MSAALEQLLRHPGLWRAGDHAAGRVASRGVASGDAMLDGWLPNGGWPAAALTELLCEQPGIGEFGLLMPLFARLTAEGERVALVAPPWLPYAPALTAAGIDLEHLLLVRPRVMAERFWAAEQLLRAGTFAAVVTWLHGEGDTRTLRRLQLAAEHGNACAFVFRGPGTAADTGTRVATPAASAGRRGAGRPRDASPAALRLRVAPCGSRVRAAARGDRLPRLVLSVIKCRGRAPATPLAL